MPRYTEDTLVQETTAAFLRDALGWQVVQLTTRRLSVRKVRAAATAKWC